MTAQIHEKIIINGKQTTMISCPPLPQDNTFIEAVPRDVLSEKIQAGEIREPVLSTACWRCYIGTWEILDGRFYLVDIVGCYKNISGNAVFADWFTGTLCIPQGRMTSYVHMGFESQYEKELLIEIEKGVVKGERIFERMGDTLHS
ncbi:MAG TPA: hypothetical protein PK253_16310 [Spirochaetota bacterium]|nr:hypothetical protein [Spirochaetota bacterium]